MKPRRYPTQLSTIGDHIRARRVDLGLTLKAVGRQLGVDSTTVTNWEKGRTTTPDLRVMPKVIDFLGYEPADANRTGTSGAGIVQFRRSRGISQKELAWLLGVDPTTLARWEKGTSRPAGLLLSRIQRSRTWRGGFGAAIGIACGRSDGQSAPRGPAVDRRRGP